VKIISAIEDPVVIGSFLVNPDRGLDCFISLLPSMLCTGRWRGWCRRRLARRRAVQELLVELNLLPGRLRPEVAVGR